MGTLTTHKERRIIYRLLFQRTGARVPNHAIDMVSDRTLQNIVEKAKKIIEKEEKAKKQRKTRWLRRHLA